MKLIDKYIFKQVILATIVGLITFIVVWISPEILFKIIKKAIDGEISTLTAFKLFFLEIPEILGTLIPSSLMLGCIWVFDRLSRDSELTIFRGIGVSFSRMFRPVLVISLIGVVSCFLISQYLIPPSVSALNALKKRVNQDYFIFVDKTETGKPKQILIVGNYDGKHIKNVKLLTFSGVVSNNNPLISSISMADEAHFNKDYWTLKDVTEYEISADGVYRNIKKTGQLNVLSPESSEKAYKLMNYSLKRSKEMNMGRLTNYISLLESADMQNEYRYMLNKFHQRFAQAFSCILFALCGAVLGFGRPREKKFVGFTIGIGLIFLYLIIIPFIEVLAQIGILNPILAAWVPNLIIFTAIVSVIKHKQI